ncbi:MAG: amino acid permease [Streptosporangiales bacterium]|nr:amino acid permease [Streptosporangiales bacterium]
MATTEQRFAKVLGPFDVFALAFGAMIGFGWIVLAGDWLSTAGTLGASAAFLIGGVVVLSVGLVYAELVSALPKTGGEHEYALKALGARGSFVASWAIALGYISVVAFEAVAFPYSLEYLWDGFVGPHIWTVADYDVHAGWVAAGVLGAVVITWLNYVGIKPSAVFQTVIVVFLLLVGVLMVVGVPVGGSTANMEPLFAGGSGGLITVLLMTPFLFVGFDVIPQSSEEMNIPYRKMGTLLLISVAAAVTWYVLVVLTLGSGLNEAGREASELPTADALGAMFGSDVIAAILVLGGLAGIVTSWNGFMIGASRILFAMADSGMLPAWLGRLHPKYKTPYTAVLLVGGLSVIAPFFGRSALLWLTNAGSANIVVSYFLTALSFVVLRRTQPDLARPFRAGKGPYVGIIAMVLALGMFVLYLPGMNAGLVWPQEWLIVAVWWVFGLAALMRMKPAEVETGKVTGRPTESA